MRQLERARELRAYVADRENWPPGLALLGFAAGAGCFGIGLTLVIKEKMAGWALVLGGAGLSAFAYRHWRAQLSVVVVETPTQEPEEDQD